MVYMAIIIIDKKYFMRTIMTYFKILVEKDHCPSLGDLRIISLLYNSR